MNAKDTEITCSQFFSNVEFPKITDFPAQGRAIDFGEFKLQVLETPGHTAGSLCFFEESQGLLFSGDTLFSGSFGRTDLPTGSSENLAESLKKLQKESFKALFPGHGPVLNGKEHNRENLLQALHTLATKAFL